LKTPGDIAAFIINNSYPVRHSLNSDLFVKRNGSLNNTLFRIQSEKEATVAFLGGSITFNEGWRNKVTGYLQEMYPDTKFTFIAAGIPSLGSLPHAFRVQKDVLDMGRIDLLFVESAVNDHANSTPPLIQRKALEGIIRNVITRNPYTNIVMMAFADEDKLKDYEEGRVPGEVNNHAVLSSYYKLPFIDLAHEVHQRITSGEFTWKYDFKDLHPSPFGQEIYFQSIRQLLWSSMAGKKPATLEAAVLPAPLEKFNYAKGKYLDIQKAVRKQNFGIDSSWQPKDNAGTRPGFVKVPVLAGEQAGASFALSFRGRAIGIAVVAGPDAGIINYRIDGKAAKSIDLFTQWSGSLHLPWYLVLGDELSAGKHELELTVAADHNPASKGNACRIVYFLVNE
jgi:sialidase-1